MKHDTTNDCCHRAASNSGIPTLISLPCVGRCKPISIGALLSMLVDVAVEQKPENTLITGTSRTSKDTKTRYQILTHLEHLPLSLLRYDSRSFRSGLLTTGMFSVCQKHSNKSRTQRQKCGTECFIFFLHLLQPVAHRMDEEDAHC